MERKSAGQFADELRAFLDSEGMERVDDAEINEAGYQKILAALTAYGEQVAGQVREEEREKKLGPPTGFCYDCQQTFIALREHVCPAEEDTHGG
jgi:hypothetical protein